MIMKFKLFLYCVALFCSCVQADVSDSFDYDAGTQALLNFRDIEFVFYAGAHWNKFDRDKGGRIIIEAGHPEYIYKAGDQWKTFDYVNGWLALEISMKKFRYTKEIVQSNTQRISVCDMILTNSRKKDLYKLCKLRYKTLFNELF